ncbi:MAG: hypothetical protein ABFS45_01590 [Pseudomonadota bacterium]
MKLGLHRTMGSWRRVGIRIGAQFGGVAVRDHVLATAVVTFHRVTAFVGVIGDEGVVLHAEMLGIIRVGEAMAMVALDPIAIEGLVEIGAIGGRGAAIEPASGIVTTDAEIARAIEVLFGDGQRGPEDGIPPGMGHHAAAPVVQGFDVLVIVAMAVGACLHRVQRYDVILRLGARQLDLIGYDVRAPGGTEREDG